MTRVKKIIVAAAVCVMVSLCAVFAVGCNSSGAGTVNATLTDAPPVMKAGHEGRYQDLGAEGCYGCHGTNAEGKAMLKAAPSIPSSHLSVEQATSTEDILSDHMLCITCHVPQSTTATTTTSGS